MKKTILALATLSTLALVGGSALAAPPADPSHQVAGDWEKLGQREVDGKADHDTIAVGRDDGHFRSIQIQVDGSALEMFEIKVTFGDGQTFEPKTRLVFDKNTRSRVIDLPGDRRVIKKVEFRYGNLPGGGRARVELWAKAAPPAPAAEPAHVTGNWEKLGQREVDGKLDRDAIAVGRDDGRFRSIQIQVEGSALEMFDVKVTFGDGQTFEPKTRLVFDKNTRSRVIDLPGDRRVIKKVEFRYGNLPGGGRARVELWAKD